MRIVVHFLVLVGFAGVARAGLDCDEGETVKRIEAFARSAKAKPEEYDFLCLSFSTPKMKRRIENACTKILDRDPKHQGCAIAVAAQGTAVLGKHDIFAMVVAMREDPVEYDGSIGFSKTMLLGNLGDVRGITVIREMWTAAQPRADAREKKKRSMVDWSSWRQKAAVSLGQLGGADEVTFLEQQAAATKDKGVARACREAIAAIKKRTGTP
jgi:hypothetical protein